MEPRSETGARSRVSFDDDAFGFVNGDEDSANEVVGVVGPDDEQECVAALTRARRRMYLVDQDGVEYSELEAMNEAVARAEDFFHSPNWVGDPRVSEVGVTLQVDCKGFIPPPMRGAFMRILAEELAPLAALDGQIAVVNVKDDE